MYVYTLGENDFIDAKVYGMYLTKQDLFCAIKQLTVEDNIFMIRKCTINQEIKYNEQPEFYRSIKHDTEYHIQLTTENICY